MGVAFIKLLLDTNPGPLTRAANWRGLPGDDAPAQARCAPRWGWPRSGRPWPWPGSPAHLSPAAGTCPQDVAGRVSSHWPRRPPLWALGPPHRAAVARLRGWND